MSEAIWGLVLTIGGYLLALIAVFALFYFCITNIHISRILAIIPAVLAFICAIDIVNQKDNWGTFAVCILVSVFFTLGPCFGDSDFYDVFFNGEYVDTIEVGRIGAGFVMSAVIAVALSALGQYIWVGFFFIVPILLVIGNIALWIIYVNNH